MIRINENYSIDADPMNWILCDSTPGKDGKRPAKARQSYHSTLEQVLMQVITRSGKDCLELKMIIRKIERCRSQIVEAVRDVDLQKAA